MADITFEIKKHIGNLTNKEEGLWNVELNVIAWNGGAPKFDIRSWSPDHSKCGKGITMSGEELKNLKKLLEGSEEEIFDINGEKLIF